MGRRVTAYWPEKPRRKPPVVTGRWFTLHRVRNRLRPRTVGKAVCRPFIKPPIAPRGLCVRTRAFTKTTRRCNRSGCTQDVRRVSGSSVVGVACNRKDVYMRAGFKYFTVRVHRMATAPSISTHRQAMQRIVPQCELKDSQRCKTHTTRHPP